MRGPLRRCRALAAALLALAAPKAALAICDQECAHAFAGVPMDTAQVDLGKPCPVPVPGDKPRLVPTACFRDPKDPKRVWGEPKPEEEEPESACTVPGMLDTDFPSPACEELRKSVDSCNTLEDRIKKIESKQALLAPGSGQYQKRAAAIAASNATLAALTPKIKDGREACAKSQLRRLDNIDVPEPCPKEKTHPNYDNCRRKKSVPKVQASPSKSPPASGSSTPRQER